MKKETDDASKKRLAAIEAEIEKLSREYADLEEVWKKEKSEALGEKSVRDKNIDDDNIASEYNTHCFAAHLAERVGVLLHLIVLLRVFRSVRASDRCKRCGI